MAYLMAWHGMAHMALATHLQHWAATSLEKVGGIWGHYQPNEPKALGITLRILFSPSRFFQLFHPLNCFSPSEMCPEVFLDLHSRTGGSALLLLSRNTGRCHNGKLSCWSLFHSHLSLGFVVVFLATFPCGDSRFRLIFRSFRFKGAGSPRPSAGASSELAVPALPGRAELPPAASLDPWRAVAASQSSPGILPG